MSLDNFLFEEPKKQASLRRKEIDKAFRDEFLGGITLSNMVGSTLPAILPEYVSWDTGALITLVGDFATIGLSLFAYEHRHKKLNEYVDDMKPTHHSDVNMSYQSSESSRNT